MVGSWPYHLWSNTRVKLAKSFPDAHLVIVGPRADLHDPKLADFGKRIESLWLSPRTVEALNKPEQVPMFEIVS